MCSDKMGTSRKILKAGFTALGIILLWPSLSLDTWADEICYLYTPLAFQRQGGPHRLGPFSSVTECRSVRDNRFRGSHDARCDCTEEPKPEKIQEVCYLYTPLSYQRQGGPHRHGPFSSRDACDSFRDNTFRGSLDARCDCSSG